MKVIHVVESLDRGAVENWLVRMMAHAHVRGETPNWTFYCQLAEKGARDEEVRAMGGRIVLSPVPLGRTGAFMAALRTELRRGGYDVMHCHHDIVSAIYMAASVGLPIRRRLVHVHNADESLPTPSLVKAALLREPMRQICLTADRVVGISNHTLDAMLSGRPRRPGRDVVHYYGVDPVAFTRTSTSRCAFRESIGLPVDALILLFAGRITPEKNPVYAVDVLAALCKSEPRAVAVFAGAGSMEENVKIRAAELGIAERVRMVGWRADLADVMAASDWFILPRPEKPMEGFGLAVVEAQLAGLRMLLSVGVPDDPLLPTAVYRRLSLGEPPAVWAASAIAMLGETVAARETILAALATSPMNMDRALADMRALHS
jgi:glycosyltransferase involved in cell wall biosynthesis